MKELLVGKFQFAEKDIKVLTDPDATHAQIVQAFQQHLIAQADSRTLVVFHFSGHGSQMKDRSGDEVDGMDETIVPVDSRTLGVYDISDDELNGLFTQLNKKTKNVTFVLDCCHSGTGTRGVALARRVDADNREPPPDPPYAVSVPRGARTVDERLEGRDYALLAGCRADELSYEHSDEHHQPCGALTYSLVNEIRRWAGTGVTYRDVMDKVKAQVNRAHPSQHPQLEGANMNHAVFGDAESLAEPFVLASPSGNEIVLAAGLVHGMTAGSIFDIYPPGTKTFAAPAKPLAQAEVKVVEDVTARAKQPSGQPIPEASRAVERQHSFGAKKIRLLFIGPEGSKPLAAIKKTVAGDILVAKENAKSPKYSDIFAVAATGKDAQLVVQQQRLEAGGESLFLSAGDATPLSPPVPVSDPKAAERILEQLVKWSQWFRVLDIENPQSGLQVQFQVSRAALPGARDVKLTGEVDLTVAEGAELKYTVKNLSKTKVYFTILDLATDGSIGVVYPPEGEQQALEPGGTWQEQSGTSVPEGRTRVRDFLKLMATPTPVDFRFLRREGVKDLPQGIDDPLVRLLGAATFAERQVVPIKARVAGWATKTQVVEVVKSGTP